MKTPIILYCEKCKEMMPIVLRFARSGWRRSQSVVADCSHCGNVARAMSIIEAVHLGAELTDIIRVAPAERRRGLLVQEAIAGLETTTPPKKKGTPEWLQKKMKEGYAKRANKHKQAQGRLF